MAAEKKDEKTVITVTDEQNAALLGIAEGVKKITGRMLKDYWSVGKLVDDVIKPNGDKGHPVVLGAQQAVRAGCGHRPAEVDL